METYRLHRPTFAILTIEEERVPITIPVNASVDVLMAPSVVNARTLIDVEWEGRTVLVFARDLEVRASVSRASAREFAGMATRR